VPTIAAVVSVNSVPLTVVAIGASAGGVEAFHRFFEKMVPDSGLGFIVVLHLAPDRKSMLPEILARWTAMPVSEAHDGDLVVANHVLVIPPGTVGALRDGRLSLRQISPNAPREIAPIDALFDTMAQSLNEDAIGVILSGTGHDGALGLKAIKARGGLTLAQGANGTAPEYSGMPNSAVAAGAVDLFVPVEQMPALIVAAHEARLASSRGAAGSMVDFDSIRTVLCEILRTRLGHDFSQYKKQTFMRRVQRRMRVLRIDQYNTYIERLQTDQEQVVLLFRDLLIGVTSFFRDSATFAILEKTVIPRLFQDKDASSDLRIWVPGCATGEEAYSLASLLLEHMDRLAFVPKVQIFASDIDDSAIATARAGRYPATLLDGVSEARRARFFVEGTGGYAVQQRVRELCTFSTHSLIRDPPFSRMELISCRNLLIYMDSALQDRVIPIFHYALVPGGTLVLGASETIGPHERLFQPVDRLNRIFVRLSGPSEVSSVYPVAESGVRQGMEQGVVRHTDPRMHWPKAVAIANRRALENFAAPFVVVGREGEVVHFSGHTGRFLEPAHGAPTTNLFQLARRGWGLELRSALRRCIDTGLPVEQRRTIVAADGAAGSPVRLIVEPLPHADADQLYMIVFDEAESPNRPGDASQVAVVPEANEAIAQLERENRDLRDQLQSIAEEHATSVEELRSSNEELQSVNEEVQSTNEELETSREEIQSINEELHTVNAQLAAKVEQLDRTNSDLRNLFDSMRWTPSIGQESS
jgi:two-component system CheB/CheR fusion protein